MINVARASVSRISAQADRDERPQRERPRLQHHAEQPDRGGAAVHHRHRLLHHRRRAAAVRDTRSTTCSGSPTTSRGCAARTRSSSAASCVAIRSRCRSSTARTATSRSPAPTAATRLPISCSDSRCSIRQATGDPNLDGASWVYAALRAGRVPRVSRVTLNYGAALRGEPAVRGDAGSSQRVSSRPAVDDLPGRADRSRLSRRCRRAARNLSHRREQLRAAARGGVGSARQRADRRCAPRGDCSTTRCPGRATSSRTARSRRRSSRSPKSTTRCRSRRRRFRESAAGRDRHAAVSPPA